MKRPNSTHCSSPRTACLCSRKEQSLTNASIVLQALSPGKRSLNLSAIVIAEAGMQIPIIEAVIVQA